MNSHSRYPTQAELDRFQRIWDSWIQRMRKILVKGSILGLYEQEYLAACEKIEAERDNITEDDLLVDNS